MFDSTDNNNLDSLGSPLNQPGSRGSTTPFTGDLTSSGTSATWYPYQAPGPSNIGIDPCKHCGRCLNCVACCGCGYCRNCGRFMGQDVNPFISSPYVTYVFPNTTYTITSTMGSAVAGAGGSAAAGAGMEMSGGSQAQQSDPGNSPQD